MPWTLADIPPQFHQFTDAQKKWALVRLNAMVRENPGMDEGIAIATVINMTKDHFGIARSGFMPANFIFKADIEDAELKDGRMTFRARASSTSVDRSRERFTKRALEQMRSVGEIELTIGPSHEDTLASVTSVIGWAHPAISDDTSEFLVDGELDPKHPSSAFLWDRINDPERAQTIKLSVGGIVEPSAVKSIYDPELGASVTELDGWEWDHIFLCRSRVATNPDTAIVERAATDWRGMVFKAAADTLGRQPGGTGEGPGGVCVCPSCGHTQEHETGEACNQVKCSECGAAMTRKAEDDDKAFVAGAEFDVLSHSEKITLYYELCDKSMVEIMEDPELVEKAVWTTAYKNDLADSAFLWVAPGGKKDGEGKTVPRSLRHLPVKNKEGGWDCPHLKNAAARANQVKGASAEKRAALVNRAQRLYQEHCAEGKSEVVGVEEDKNQIDKSKEDESMDIEAEKVGLVRQLLTFIGVGKSAEELSAPEKAEEPTEKAEEAAPAEQRVVAEIPPELTQLITDMGSRLEALEKATVPAEVAPEPEPEVVATEAEVAAKVETKPEPEAEVEPVVEEEPVVEKAEDEGEEKALIAANFEALYAKMNEVVEQSNGLKAENEELKQVNAALSEQVGAIASTKGISTQVPAGVGKATPRTTQDENIEDFLANPGNWQAGNPPPYTGP